MAYDGDDTDRRIVQRRADDEERRFNQRRDDDKQLLVAVTRLEEQIARVAEDAKIARAGVHDVRELLTDTKDEIRIAMADEHRRLDKIDSDQQRRNDRLEFLLANHGKEVDGLRGVHTKLRECTERLAMTPHQQVQDAWHETKMSTRLKVLGGLVAVISAIQALVVVIIKALS